MKNILMLVALCLLSSCYTKKKATKQVVRAQGTYPEVVAGLCGNFYDPIEMIRDSIVYKPGETIWSHDTVKVDCDTVRVKGGTRIVKLPCPPCPNRTDTFYINKTQVQVNRARETELDMKLATEVKKATTYKAQRNTYLWLLVILAAYTVARWILKGIFKINILP